MIGSKRRTDIVKKKLIKEGLDGERLERICTPIGLPIHAKTIEEIDISIMAEVIAKRRMGDTTNCYIDRADHDYKLISELAKIDSPCVMATILKVEGSAPRGAGARMAIYGDGTLQGSVGGGCVESMVIHMGSTMIDSGTYRILRVSLDGKAAMAEGMVCGGSVVVLLEDFD